MSQKLITIIIISIFALIIFGFAWYFDFQQSKIEKEITGPPQEWQQEQQKAAQQSTEVQIPEEERQQETAGTKEEEKMKDIPLKDLFPKLEKYGFKLQEITEMTQSEFIGLGTEVGEQFGITVPQQALEERFPLLSAFGEYKKNDERLKIEIFKFAEKSKTEYWFNKEITDSKELESMFKTSSVIAKLEKIEINNKEAYYFIFGSSDTKLQAKPGYETSLFWQNDIYVFSLKFYSEEPWLKMEAVQIAEEIK